MKRYRTARWFSLILVVALLGACDDDPTDPDPQDFDPIATSEDFTEVLNTLQGAQNALVAVDAAVAATVDFSGLSVAPLLSVRPDGAFREGKLRWPATDVMRTARSTSEASFTLPSEIVGETLVWDTDLNRYVVDRDEDGAPSDGVRVVYYAMNPVTGQPSEPLGELGFIDLTDEDLAAEERLGIRVVHTAGDEDVDLLDYHVGLQGFSTPTDGELVFTAEGFLSDGTDEVDFDLFQEFTWDQETDTDELVISYAYESEAIDISLDLEARSAFDAAAWEEVDLDVDLTDGQGNINLDATIHPDETVDGEISFGGEVVIVIGGIDGSPTFTRPDGDELGDAEMDALEDIWTGMILTVNLTDLLLQPSLVLLFPG